MSPTTNITVWSPGVTLETVEEQIIKRALSHYKGNKTATAASLGIAVRTLDNKLEKYFEDEKKHEQSMEEEKKRRADFLARCRGQVPPSEDKRNEEPIVIDVEVESKPGLLLDDEDGIQITSLKSKKRG